MDLLGAPLCSPPFLHLSAFLAPTGSFTSEMRGMLFFTRFEQLSPSLSLHFYGKESSYE